MSAAKLPPCPPQLKQVQHYLKIAQDYDKIEPVVSYWVRLYALQTALKLDRKSPEARALLTALMDYLEEFKKENADNEAVTSDVAGQALVENYVHKVFSHADTEDRAARFNRNMVKAFYSAGLLCDVCQVFGELTDEIAAQRKYAKWKATYINNCLKKGETPIPGPMGGEDEGLGEDVGGGEGEGAVGGASQPPPSSYPPPAANYPPPAAHQPPPMNMGWPQPPTGAPTFNPPTNVTPPVPAPRQSPAATPAPSAAPTSFVPAAHLPSAQIKSAQKYCQWAASALDYDDTRTAIDNIQKALSILTTGQGS